MVERSHRSYGNVRVDPRGVFYRELDDQVVPAGAVNPLPVTAPIHGLDAFGRQRVSTAYTHFDWQSRYNEAPLWFENILVNLATVQHLPNESSVKLQVTAAAGSEAIRQSREYIRYQPGKGQFIGLTFVMGTPKTNVRRRAGYFDDENGLFLEQSNGTLYVVERSFTSGVAVDAAVPQTSWNVDPMDGTGPSGITLDITKLQVLVIDLLWLGGGQTRFGFDIDGRIYYVHIFKHGNVVSQVYMTTANLPIRWEITNTGVPDSPSELVVVCGVVFSEAGHALDGIVHSVANATTGISVTTRRAILSIRPKLTFNGLVNRGQIISVGYSVFATNNNVYFEILYGHMLGGIPVWTSVNDDSIVEYDVAGTTLVNGVRAGNGYVAAGRVAGASLTTRSVLAKLPLTLSADGTDARILSLVCTAVGGPAATCYGALEWIEIY